MSKLIKHLDIAEDHLDKAAAIAKRVGAKLHFRKIEDALIKVQEVLQSSLSRSWEKKYPAKAERLHSETPALDAARRKRYRDNPEYEDEWAGYHPSAVVIVNGDEFSDPREAGFELLRIASDYIGKRVPIVQVHLVASSRDGAMFLDEELETAVDLVALYDDLCEDAPSDSGEQVLATFSYQIEGPR